MPTDEQPTQQEAHVSMLMEISNAMSRVFKVQLGRGPTGARAYWLGQDGVAVVLEDTLTPAERRLVEMGAAPTRRSEGSRSRRSCCTGPATTDRRGPTSAADRAVPEHPQNW